MKKLLSVIAVLILVSLLGLGCASTPKAPIVGIIPDYQSGTITVPQEILLPDGVVSKFKQNIEVFGQKLPTDDLDVEDDTNVWVERSSGKTVVRYFSRFQAISRINGTIEKVRESFTLTVAQPNENFTGFADEASFVLDDHYNHVVMSKATKVWLDKLAATMSYAINEDRPRQEELKFRVTVDGVILTSLLTALPKQTVQGRPYLCFSSVDQVLERAKTYIEVNGWPVDAPPATRQQKINEFTRAVTSGL